MSSATIEQLFQIVLTRRQTSLVESLNDRHDPVKLRSEAQVLWWRRCIQGRLNCVHGWNTWYWSKGTMGGHGVLLLLLLLFQGLEWILSMLLNDLLKTWWFQRFSFQVVSTTMAEIRWDSGRNWKASWLPNMKPYKSEFLGYVFFLKVSRFFFPEFVYLKMFSDTWWCLNLQWKFGMYLYIRADYQLSRMD